MDILEHKLKETKVVAISVIAIVLILAIIAIIAIAFDYQKYESPHQKRMNLIEEKSAILELDKKIYIDSLYNSIRYWSDSVLTEIEKEEQVLKSQK